jgi:hypothetical protein
MYFSPYQLLMFMAVYSRLKETKDGDVLLVFVASSVGGLRIFIFWPST